MLYVPERRASPSASSASGPTSSSRSWASTTTATSSCPTSPPGAGASSTSRARSGSSPKVILFDEPSSGIAQRETEALGPLLLRIRDITGASILLIEHDMPLITSVSDRIVALRPRPGRRRRRRRDGAQPPAGRRVVPRLDPRGRSSGPTPSNACSTPSEEQANDHHDDPADGTAARSARARDSPTRTPELGCTGSSASTGTRSASPGRRCSGRCLSPPEAHAEVAVLHPHPHHRSACSRSPTSRGAWSTTRSSTRPRRSGRTSRTSRSGRCGASSSGSRSNSSAIGSRTQIEFDLRVWLYTHIQSADLRRLDQVATGQLVTRSLTDLQLVEHAAPDLPDADRLHAAAARGRRSS